MLAHGSACHPVNHRRTLCVLLVGVAFAWLGASTPGDEFWLITPEEAAKPGAPANADALNPFTTRGLSPLEVGRDVDTGPMIEVLKPSVKKVETTPVEVSVKFAPRSAPVDISSLKVQVVKLIPIDITDRVRPYTDPEGIHIPDARLPSGEHKVRISLSDKDGGMTRKEMTVTIP